jgi:hypothetical protein
MDYARVRELIRVRHELRRLTAEGLKEEARAMLDRLRALAQEDPTEAADVQPELIRWSSSLAAE